MSSQTGSRFRRWLLPTELPELPLSAGRDALFVRLAGLVYVFAFASLWPQIPGLFGENGVLPTQIMLEHVAKDFGSRKYWLLPTLFWQRCTESALMSVCGMGLCAGIAVFFLRMVWPALAVAWVCHLSFLVIGGPFLSFQWDLLLSEMGLLLLLAVPITYKVPQPLVLVPVGRWLLLWLLFRVVWSSGYLKLAALDPTWHNLTALHYHFETQPLPTVVGYYAHALPGSIKKGLAAYTLFTEAVLPFALFLPRWRFLFVGPLVLLQVGIALTGNQATHNLLVLLLVILLLPATTFSFLRPRPSNDVDQPSRHTRRTCWVYALPRAAFALVLFVASLGHFSWTLRSHRDVPTPVRWAMQATAPFFAVSHYGAFASMTTNRPELVIEGSQDGVSFREYHFPFKPGQVTKRPRWSAPYQPRLDWQMWFAALGRPTDSPWLHILLLRLLEGSHDVLWLFDGDPFLGQRPRYLRVQLYPYRFSTIAEKRATGAYFVRQAPLPFISPVGLTVEKP